MKPGHRSMQQQLFRLVAISFVVVLIVAAGAIFAYEQTTFHSRMEAGARAQAATLADILEDALLFVDRSTAERYLAALRSRSDVVAAAVYDRDHALFATYSQSDAAVVAPEVIRDLTPKFSGRTLQMTVPVTSDGEAVGHVWLQMKLPTLLQRLTNFGLVFAVSTAAMFLLALSLSLLIRRDITDPVRRLADTAHDVAVRNDFSLRSDLESGGEIGELTGAFNAMLDTIESRGRSLIESEERFRRAFENAPIGVCLTSVDGRFLRINHSLCAMLGYTVEELSEKHIADITHPDDIGKTRESVSRLLDGLAESIQYEKRYHHKSGRLIWAAVHAVLLRGGDGSPIHFVVHIVDVTAQKNADQERERLEAQLLQSQKMEALGTLSGGIAHDFNNVLTAITGNAALALEDLAVDHPAHESVEEIQTASRRATDMVRRILAFSRFEEPDLQVTDLAPVVEEAVTLLRSTIPAMIDIHLECDGSVPSVLADPTQIHQVIMNLGTNARDAMAGTKGTLTFKLGPADVDARLSAVAPEMPPGPCACISICDTGSGMTDDVLGRVFEPFFTTKPQGAGTGMGLSVVHGIMRRHGGAILVSSDPGRGTTFDLYFPPAGPGAGPVHHESTLKTHSAKGNSTSGRRLLYVDDEEPLVYLATRMLKKMGYEVEGRSDPRKALSDFKERPDHFDLVITDLGMPGMSGLDLIAKLHEIRADLPVIITSGFVRPEDSQRAKELGVKEIILKPNTVEEMADVIHERLTGGGTASVSD